MRFMQTESVLQTKNRSGPAKNRFSVALICTGGHCGMVKAGVFKPFFLAYQINRFHQ